jgi:hypothetical protein
MDQHVNPEVLTELEIKLRRFSLESKLETSRKLSHSMSPYLSNNTSRLSGYS